MFNMMGKISEVKEKAEEARAKFPFIELEAYSDDEMIRVKVTADKKIQEIEIKEGLFVQDKKPEVEDKLQEVINEALKKADDAGKQEMKNHLDGTIPNIPGLDINNLPF